MTKKVENQAVSFLRKFAFADTQETGEWVEVQGARLRIARFGNPNHQTVEMGVREKLRSEFDKLLTLGEDQRKERERELENQIRVETFAKAILLDWENVADPEGNPIEYTVEQGITHLEMPEFFAIVADHSLDVEQYRKFKEAEAVKN